MNKSSETKVVAQEIVKLIPQIMRTLWAEQYFSSYPIAPAHFRLLTILASHSCNLSELAVRQAVSLPTMSNSISVLVERGWVKRAPSPDDRRQILLELTPDGQTVLADLKGRVEARVGELLGVLSPDELASLSAGLIVLERAFAPAATCSRPNSLARKVKRTKES